VQNSRQVLGAKGEDFASRFLIQQGLICVHKNWRCSFGEIDLIMFEEISKTIVAVEVKTRRNQSFGDPLEALTIEKVKRLHKLIRFYRIESGYFDMQVRVDAIGITLEPEFIAEYRKDI
jgi:putative endonuclease